MRRLPLLAAALALALAPPAHAYTYGPWGCNLRWDHCYGDGGVFNKAFACDTDGGTDVLVGSFVPEWGITDVGALFCELNIASASATIPAWWQFVNAGSCRQFDGLALSAVPVDPVVTACADWSAGTGFPNLFPQVSSGLSGPNTLRMVCTMNVVDTRHVTLQGLVEYFAFQLALTHAKTVGTGACAGCTTPVCIVFSQVVLATRHRSDNRYLTGPANLTDSDHVTWQGGGSPTVGTVTGCPAATPTRQPTWGRLKAMYR